MLTAYVVFGGPKYVLNALVPCGHTYRWCSPAVAVLKHHGQSNLLHSGTFGACTPWLLRGIDYVDVSTLSCDSI